MQQGKTCTLQLPVHYIYIDVVACAGPEVHVIHTNRFELHTCTYTSGFGQYQTTSAALGTKRELSEEQICNERTWMEKYYMWPHLDTRGCKTIILRRTTYTSREHPFHCQKHCQECSCSAGGTMSCTCHTRPFYRLFPLASGRNSEGPLTTCAWHQQSCTHQPQGSEKDNISPSNLPSAAL